MDSRISHLRSILVEEFAQPWTVSRMAELVNLSPAHFSRLFTKQIGVSPAAFLHEQRMKSACKLLEDATCFLRIKEIRVTVGLNDASHFTRDFKNRFGMTPSAYRNWAREMTELRERNE